MHSKSDTIEIMIHDKADKVMEELFKSLLNRHQNNLEKLMKDTEIVFNYVQLLYYKCHKINPNRGDSYIDSLDLYIDFPDWIKTTINPTNKKDIKCFQYIVTVALNHEKIKKDSPTNNNKK